MRYHRFRSSSDIYDNSDEFSSDCRVCPGKGFAEVSMFIFCASMLHTLSFSPPLDEHGKPKELDVYMGSALAVS